MNVKNQRFIRGLALSTMRAKRLRNRVAILAIALTTVLFTALFTIVLSIGRGVQEANFRQIGSFSHGDFKYLSLDQYEALSSDPLIKESGVRRLAGIASGAPFEKSQVEISYMDKNTAHWDYCVPSVGAYPKEGTNEAATDTRVLQLLGVSPELGNEFTVTFESNGVLLTKTFTLCGYWEYDPTIYANHILLPLSAVTEIWDEADVTVPQAATSGWETRMYGSYNLSVMFRNASHIERDMEAVLFGCGYQSTDPTDTATYVRTGVNWGYASTFLANTLDPAAVLVLLLLLLIILAAGCLIIYNVFQISVTNNIRYYGLLKTVGTTGRQIRTMLRTQALLLSLIGIPIGLCLGYLIGAVLTPLVLRNLNVAMAISVHPFIFLFATLCALLTVLLSTGQPGRLAGKVPPIEAARFTEKRRKNPVTVISLAVSAILLTLSVTLANGFDTEKYLKGMDYDVCDFILANAGLFHGFSTYSADQTLPERAIEAVTAGRSVTGGRVYAVTGEDGIFVQALIPTEHYRTFWEDLGLSSITEAIPAMEHVGDSVFADFDLLGIEPALFPKLEVLDGDLSALSDPSAHAVAACYSKDDYGNLSEHSNFAKVGDTVTIRYITEYSFYNLATGEEIAADAIRDPHGIIARAKTYEEEKYTVVALVDIPYTLTSRTTGGDLFLMNDTEFCERTHVSGPLLYAFDAPDSEIDATEELLSAYTEQIDPSLDYESIQKTAEDFDRYRRTYLLLGAMLSLLVGLIGVLNFFNVTLTGIFTRRREFATLQAIGMTGRQLKVMLVKEGVFYTALSIGITLLVILTTAPLFSRALESLFWFFRYHLTVAPALLLAPLFLGLGILIPLLSYRSIARQTIVERLREDIL